MTIVEELRKDRESGARRLEAEYKAGLMTLARRFCTDPGDAEELVNATFAAVVDSIDNYLEQSAFFGWMCQILTNIYTMDSRRKSNQTVTCPGVVPDMADDSAQEAIYDNLDAALLRRAIDTLPKDQRDAIALHYFMDMSVAQIAKYLAVPTGTVLSRLHYARKALAAKLGAEVKESAKKPGAKALLIALALCALTAIGAVGVAKWGELSERAATGETGETSGTSGTGGSSSVAPVSTPVPPDSPVPPVPEVPFVPAVPSTTLSKETTMNTTTRTAALGAATALALAAAPPAASADDYQYIISGDPVAAATEGMTASRSTPPGPLEMREHAVARSRATALTSTKPSAFTIIVR